MCESSSGICDVEGSLEGFAISAYRKTTHFEVRVEKKYLPYFCQAFTLRGVIPSFVVVERLGPIANRSCLVVQFFCSTTLPTLTFHVSVPRVRWTLEYGSTSTRGVMCAALRVSVPSSSLLISDRKAAGSAFPQTLIQPCRNSCKAGDKSSKDRTQSQEESKFRDNGW